MTMYQYYYTSCRRGVEGISGFQVKAISSGLNPEVLDSSRKMLNYRIPISSRDRPLSEHPVALRYNNFDDNTGMMVCCQSSGTDEVGRPGNFFAHAIFTPTTDLEIYPPISFWRHSFWKLADPSSSLEIPPEPSFALEPETNLFDQIWPFLDQPGNRERFYRLMCAVIRYDETHRPIVILDHPDNIARWIAAVSFALPMVLRPYISFATYHHDPYHAGFRITGTTSDSEMRFSQDEYVTFFIMNMEAGQISDVEPNVAADFICANFTPRLFEDRLLDFFAICNSRLSRTPFNLGSRLENSVRLHLITREHSRSITTPADHQAFSQFISQLDTQTDFSDEDLIDLNSAREITIHAMLEHPDPQYTADYRSILGLWKRKVPGFEENVVADASILVKLIANSQFQYADQLLEVYQEVYGPDLLKKAFSSSAFISILNIQLRNNDLRQFIFSWKRVFPHVSLDQSNQDSINSFTRLSLRLADQVPGGVDIYHPAPATDQLIEALVPFYKGREDLLADLLSREMKNYKNFVVGWIYFQLVRDVPLVGRSNTRNTFLSLNPGIIAYEYYSDLISSSPSLRYSKLLEWLNYIKKDWPDRYLAMMPMGVKVIWEAADAAEKPRMAFTLMTSDIIYPYLPTADRTAIFMVFIETQKMGMIPPGIYPICLEQFNKYEFSPKIRYILGGSLAMTDGAFRNGTPREINNWLATLGMDAYTEEARKLIKRFFSSRVTIESHRDMILSVYVLKYQQAFWEQYWSNLKGLLLAPGYGENVASFFDFWFDDAPIALSTLPYIIAGFFMHFNFQIEDLKSSKDYSKQFAQAADGYRPIIETRKWYPLVKDLFSAEKKKVLGLF
jgi:hypothetical protein